MLPYSPSKTTQIRPLLGHQATHCTRLLQLWGRGVRRGCWGIPKWSKCRSRGCMKTPVQSKFEQVCMMANLATLGICIHYIIQHHTMYHRSSCFIMFYRASSIQKIGDTTSTETHHGMPVVHLPKLVTPRCPGGTPSWQRPQHVAVDSLTCGGRRGAQGLQHILVAGTCHLRWSEVIGNGMEMEWKWVEENWELEKRWKKNLLDVSWCILEFGQPLCDFTMFTGGCLILRAYMGLICRFLTQHLGKVTSQQFHFHMPGSMLRLCVCFHEGSGILFYLPLWAHFGGGMWVLSTFKDRFKWALSQIFF